MNLSEVIIQPSDTLDTIRAKVRIATIFGTLQSTLSNFRYLSKIWKQNQEEERLLGVSMTGIMDHKVMSNTWGKWRDEYGNPDFERFLGPHYNSENTLWSLPDVLDDLHEYARAVNREFAEILGIPASKQISLIKPSGTVSQLCGTASGIHPRYSKFYLRRVTQDNKDPLTDLMIAQGIPYKRGEDKTHFSFPVKAPEGSIVTKDVKALQQLELWRIYREHWCEGNPSCTIYYTDEDFFEVQAWVYKNFDIIGGLSFFPYDDYIYDKETQPYLPITEEEYEKYLQEFPSDISWDMTGLEDDDNTTGSQEFACAGGSCDIP